MSCTGRREEEEEDARTGVKSEKEDPLLLFIKEWIDGMRGNRGGQKMDMRQHRWLDFQELIKKRIYILRFGPCIILMTGDVMAGYHNRRR